MMILYMMLCQNALYLQLNLECSLVSAWLHESNIKFPEVLCVSLAFPLQPPSSHNTRTLILVVEICFHSTTEKNLQWTPHNSLASHSRAAAFWFQQSLSVLIRVFYMPNIPHDFFYMSHVPHDCPNHFFSIECPPSTILSFKSHFICSLFPKPFLLPQPGMICPLALYLYVFCVQCWMYEWKDVGLCLWYLPCIGKG